ncbi:T9SS type A sorting domain-containing protein, partial [Avrilella dinanensis]|uniref:T9SS type A sorting domain-containing protein n=1 Tax=Avrilella dinanensis TaxID=2008672 RepID=UPI0030C6769D
VALTLKPNAIETIYPNPATADVITVDYTINEGTSAYLSITGTYMSNVSNNYILDTNQDQIAINVSNYPLGAYIITLVTDGNISDSENLIIH